MNLLTFFKFYENMNYLLQQILVWIGGYFPIVRRLFGLKILTYGYTDITPDLCTGSRPSGNRVESKVSWLIQNLSGSSLSIKIIIYCNQANDGWIQIYQVNQCLQGGWSEDFSCGEEKFDSE